MKSFIISIFIVSFCLCQSADPDSIKSKPKTIGFDKIQHAAVSCLLTISGQYVLENKSNMNENDALSYSIGYSASIGLVKELNDMKTRQTIFDWGDMMANFMGIGLAVLIITN